MNNLYKLASRYYLFKKAFYQGPHPRCKEVKMVSNQIATKIEGVVGGLHLSRHR
jgi:hypothetical protein